MRWGVGWRTKTLTLHPLQVIEYILFFVFALDIAIRFRRAYYDDAGLVTSPRAIALNYARTLLPLDILGVLPLDYILIPAIYGTGPMEVRGARLLALLGLLRMARLHRVVAFFRYLDFNLAISLVVITIVRNLVYVLFVVHWAACGLYFIARVHDPTFEKVWGVTPKRWPRSPRRASGF